METTVRAYKTDQDAVGEIVPIPYGSHPDTCPVRTVESWLVRLSNWYGIDSGPLLRSITRHGVLAGTALAPAGRPTADGRLTGAGINKIVRRLPRPRPRPGPRSRLSPPTAGGAISPPSCTATSAPPTSGATTPCAASACDYVEGCEAPVRYGARHVRCGRQWV